jgi:protein involved in polysaccharide export with SLBB domain
MPATIFISLLVIAASFASSTGTTCARGIQQRPAVDAPAPPSTLPASVPLGIGDKLKISFFETIDVAPAKQGGREAIEPQGTLRTFYQRMDLSGEYTVDQDGIVSLPLLGRFRVEGRAVEDVRTNNTASFTSVIGRNANIDIKLIDRSPVYVVGPVKNPGSYKYVPGMIVLHAVALAGGIEQRAEGLSGMIEGVREMERLRSMTVQVDHLLARRARLEAERDGATTLPVPSHLTKIASERIALAFLATEGTILRAEQAKRQQQSKEIAFRITAARNELAALKQKLEQVDAQRAMRIERLNDLQKLKDNGWATSNNVVILRTELLDIEAHRQDALVAIVQAEARLTQAEGAGARLSSETTATLENAIALIDKEIAATQEAMTSARTLASILYRPGGRTLEAASYEIVRQSKEGSRTFSATETTALRPGDVLKITQKPAAFSPSSVYPVPQWEPTMPEDNNAATRIDAPGDIVGRGRPGATGPLSQ